MKIAAKLSMTALITVLSVGAAHYAMAQVGGAAAQQVANAAQGVAPVVGSPGPENAVSATQAASANSTSAIPGAPAASQPVAAAASAPASPTDNKSVKEVLDSINVPSASSEKKTKTVEAEADEEDDDNTSDMPKVDPKIPSSVKTAVKKLNSGSDNVTIDDLNSAREAIVKLDVLIDIEKRLADLAQIRKEREMKVNDLSGAMPSSALAGGGIPISGAIPPPSLPVADSSAASVPMPMPVPMMGGGDPSVSIEVVRITGASGNYVASVKENGGDTPKNIRVGDKLGDGSEVVSISRNGVTVKMTNKKTKTIQVKDVDTVFSGR